MLLLVSYESFPKLSFMFLNNFLSHEIAGASTALVASIDKDGYLHALNVGDSTLLVIRSNSILTRTREIVHYFDCPFQVSVFFKLKKTTILTSHTTVSRRFTRSTQRWNKIQKIVTAR